MKQILPIEAARKVAKQSGLVSLVNRVEKAYDDGWQAIILEARPDGDGGWDIGTAAPTGVMVAWFLDAWTADKTKVAGGEPAADLHVTLAYLGDAAEMNIEQQRRLTGVVGEVCLNHETLQGMLRDTGRFVNGEDTDPFWVGVEIPGLRELRADLVTALADAGIALQGLGAGQEYTPHVTVAYIPKDAETPPLDFKPIDVTVDALTVCVGPNRFKLSLQQPESMYEDEWHPGGWAPSVVNKSLDTVEEDRYTLAPWYIPDKLDAHGEWTDRHELQKSFWKYISQEDKAIRKQHDINVVAGEIRDGVVWPFEVTVPMTKADGTVTEHTFPAGTPFLGVHWTKEAWPLVKEGKIRGYSIGGSSSRMLVDLPTQPTD